MEQKGSGNKGILQKRVNIGILLPFCHHWIIQGDYFTNHKGKTFFILSRFHREWYLCYNSIGNPTSEKDRA
jgi:hypothetical protein